MLRSVFQFSSDYYPLNEGMKKQNKTKQEKKKEIEKKKNNQPSDTCYLIKTREPSLNKQSKHLNWAQQLNVRFRNVSCSLNLSPSVYESVLQHTINLQTWLIRTIRLRGQEGVPIPSINPSQIQIQHSSVSESSYLKLSSNKVPLVKTLIYDSLTPTNL